MSSVYFSFAFTEDPCDTVSCKYHSTCRLGPNHVTSCACQKSCPATKQPVCGSNGQTYNNECLMKQNSCKKRDDIQLIVKAPCGEYQAQLSLQFFLLNQLFLSPFKIYKFYLYTSSSFSSRYNLLASLGTFQD